jgi:hypothetical protein
VLPAFPQRKGGKKRARKKDAIANRCGDKMNTPDGSERRSAPATGGKRSLQPSGGNAQTVFSPRAQFSTPNYRATSSSGNVATTSSSSSSSSPSLYPSLPSFQSPIRTPQSRRQTLASGLAGMPPRRQAPPAGSSAGPAAKRRKRVVHETDRVRLELLSPWPAEVVRRLRESRGTSLHAFTTSASGMHSAPISSSPIVCVQT